MSISRFCALIVAACLVPIKAFAAPTATPKPKSAPTPAARKPAKASTKASSTKAPAKTPTPDPESMESYLQLSKNSVPFRRAADEALTLLRDGKIDAFVARLSPQMVSSNGGAAKVRAVIHHDIAPFFAKFKKLGNSETIKPALDEYGQTGFSFYLSRIGADKSEKPFAIYMIRENGRIIVANIVPNWTAQSR